MEQIEIKEGEYFCLYCGKNIANMNKECDCPDAVTKRELIASIPKHIYKVSFIDGKHYLVDNN